MFLELRKQTLPDPRRDARTCWAPANDSGADNRQLTKTEEWSTFTEQNKDTFHSLHNLSKKRKRKNYDFKNA